MPTILSGRVAQLCISSHNAVMMEVGKFNAADRLGGRMIEPVELARAVAFLAGSDATAITAVNLSVDRGWLVASSWQTYRGLRQPGSAG